MRERIKLPTPVIQRGSVQALAGARGYASEVTVSRGDITWHEYRGNGVVIVSATPLPAEEVASRLADLVQPSDTLPVPFKKEVDRGP